MSKPKLLLIGYRAYGDWIFSMPAIHILLQNYDIHLEMNRKGYYLFHNDPRFRWKTVFEYEKYPQDNLLDITLEHWEALEKFVQADRVINLWQTLEASCLIEMWQPEFQWTDEQRRAVQGKRNFIDSVFERCEIVPPSDFHRGEFYYSPQETEVIRRWREKNANKFVILVPACGSCFNKLYPYMPKLTTELCDKYPDIKVYLTGDAGTKDFQWKHPSIVNTYNLPFKQTILMSKYANFVMGGETGLLAAAGMHGTPKIQFTTSSSVYQICKYDKNDYSVQSDAKCSPCHLAVLNYDCCHGIVDEPVKHALCTDMFSYDHAFKTVEKVYKEWKDGTKNLQR